MKNNLFKSIIELQEINKKGWGIQSVHETHFDNEPSLYLYLHSTNKPIAFGCIGYTQLANMIEDVAKKSTPKQYVVESLAFITKAFTEGKSISSIPELSKTTKDIQLVDVLLMFSIQYMLITNSGAMLINNLSSDISSASFFIIVYPLNDNSISFRPFATNHDKVLSAKEAQNIVIEVDSMDKAKKTFKHNQ